MTMETYGHVLSGMQHNAAAALGAMLRLSMTPTRFHQNLKSALN